MSPELLQLFQTSLLETLWMVGVSAAIGTVIGLPLGVLLVITDQHGLLQNRPFNRLLGLLANAVLNGRLPRLSRRTPAVAASELAR